MNRSLLTAFLFCILCTGCFLQSATEDICLQQDDRMVGLWLFDEGTGMIVHDKSQYQNNGWLAASPHTPKWDKVEKTCLTFDGLDDFVEIKDSPVLKNKNGSFAVRAWFKTSKNRDRQNIAGKYSGYGWQLEVINGFVRMTVRDVGANPPGIFVQSPQTYADSQ